MSGDGLILGLGAGLLAGGLAVAAHAGTEALEAAFREPGRAAGGPEVALALEGGEGFVRRLERLREWGAGGVLVSLPRAADAELWAALAAAAAACERLGLELGVRDFALAEEAEAAPRAGRLVWRAQDEAAGAPWTNAPPRVVEPAAGYEEVARLAVPLAERVLAHEVADLARGPQPAEGRWRVFRFGRAAVPGVFDVYDETAYFRHLNAALLALQGALGRQYGTTLLGYECAGVPAGEWAWPRDMERAFLARSGLALPRSLPALAGVPVGGEAAAAHVRAQALATVRDAWRARAAATARDLVQEAGLEAGLDVGEAPVEPEEVAAYFKRPSFAAAAGAAQRARNVRAAGAARLFARRSAVGRLAPAEVRPVAEAALLAFPYRHAVDALWADGATALRLEGGAGVWEEAAGGAHREAFGYMRRGLLLLRHGEPAADLLLWARGLPPALEGFSCDRAGREALAAASVRGGRVGFASERSYGALAVSAEILRDAADAALAARLAARGVAVWAVAERPEDEAALADLAAAAGGGVRPLPRPEALGAGPAFAWQAEEPGARLRFVRRRSPEAEVYLVVNDGPRAAAARCRFRDAGRGEPERWEALTGEIGRIEGAERHPAGGVSAPLFLGPYEACFVVFAR